MKMIKALIGVLAVTLFTTAAVAGDETGGSKHSTAKFNKMDRDKDGKLSKEEIKNDSTLTAQFAAVDQDSDGYLSEEEFTAMAQMQSPRGERSPSSTDRPSDYPRE